MSTGAIIPWMDEIIYLSVLIVRSRLFECSLDHAKKSFYRSANAIFGKVGRFASEEVTLQLIKSKCIPVLLYNLEVCPLNKSDLHSLDFVINRFFIKLFRSSNIEYGKRVNGTSGKAETTIFWPYYSGKCRTVGTYSARRNRGRATASRQTEKTVDTRH